ncbi:hypothetical protein LEMLEM_LOCUS4974, partial [Lemmus lemmus]
AYSTSSWLTLSLTRRSRSFLLDSIRRRRQDPSREHTAMVSDMVGTVSRTASPHFSDP